MQFMAIHENIDKFYICLDYFFFGGGTLAQSRRPKN